MVIIIIASVFSVILFFMGVFKCYQKRCWCFRFRKEKSATSSTIPSENNKNNSTKDIVSNPFFMGCGGTFGIEPMHCFEFKVNDWYSTQSQCLNNKADGTFSRLNGKSIDCINDCDRIAFKMDRKQNLFPDWATKEFVKFAPSIIKKSIARKESLEPLLDTGVITDEEQQINAKNTLDTQQQRKSANMQFLRFNSKVKVIPWDAENNGIKMKQEQNGSRKKQQYKLTFEPLQYLGRGEVMLKNDKDTGVIPLCEGDDDDDYYEERSNVDNVDDGKNKGLAGNNSEIPHFFKDSKDCCQLNVFSQPVKINWITPNEDMQSQSSDLSSDGRSRHKTEDEDDNDCKDKFPHKQQEE